MRLKVWPPQRWGRGIGSALMATAEQATKARQCTGIGLGVEVDNERALRFYERLGYVDWGGGDLQDQVSRLDAHGNPVVITEVFTVMTKPL